MAGIQSIAPSALQPNPENPRLIFRADELRELEDSIQTQGILVPLTVYTGERGQKYTILDGERRWRCATKLRLARVPAIVQPKPDRLQNIMMMFAIHNARRDWDPLPTAYKLQALRHEFEQRQGRAPTEVELSQMASMSRGEIRRLQRLLSLPEMYRKTLMSELEKPRGDQTLTVDHVLEATKAASSLRQRDIIDSREEEALRRSIVTKFQRKVLTNTVEPRQLARMARAVERDEVPLASTRNEVLRLIREPAYTIRQAFEASVESVDFEHGMEQMIDRLITRLDEHQTRGYATGSALSSRLSLLSARIRKFLSR